MDVLDVHSVVTDALRCAREERRPQLVEAVTYRYRGHSMADPEEYRTKEEVEEWAKRDPIATFSERLKDEGEFKDDQLEKLDEKAIEEVNEAVKFADESPFPDLDSLYDDIYVLEGDRAPAWWSVDERTPEVHRARSATRTRRRKARVSPASRTRRAAATDARDALPRGARPGVA
jgi:hypothetical protein